ncbi:MAG: hypothetical protein IKH64_09515 [Prevotella sp.]|nr:hypothetical protein [Prevotella sp.]
MKWFLLIWFVLFILCGIAQYKWDRAWEKHERKHGIYRTKTKKRRKWNWDPGPWWTW